MFSTITLCSGKGGVGKTVLAATLARIIQRQEDCNVLVVDLDLSVRGLTLLAFQNKHALDQIPVSLADYLSDHSSGEKALFEELRKSIPLNGDSAQPSLYQRLERIFILPASTESERPDWVQAARLELNQAIEKLRQFQVFARESLNVGYIIFDTQAGLGSLSLAAATLSDLTLLVLEEDDISWRTALNLFVEITELNKHFQNRSRSYFLVNKVSAELAAVAGKLRAFSFLPPVSYDVWLRKLVAQTTSSVLDQEFESYNFFRQVQSQVWKEIAVILGIPPRPSRTSFSFDGWWRK